MIAHVKGIVVEKFLNSLIVDVNGVGYELTVPALDFDAVNLNDEMKFYTYHSVRENAEELYGFSSLAGKRLFEMLISVNGIGPKAGIAILSLGSAEEVRNAIANGDSKFISTASGVGKKSAERVILELGDKVGSASSATPTRHTLNDKDEALDALMALGFQLKEATSALEEIDPNLPTEDRIRLALKNK
ncbi:Holliday junction branch migration protein RuvA [Candidatus Saccharibacteria bacterium]|nr:Holliday junction branch migration protein RuvA [Candidatus Saccharibacteria bacterium]